MRIVLLGTGGSAGVPFVGGEDGRGYWGACDPKEPRNRRTRTSIVVEGDDKQRLLVDTGPDMRGQLLDAAISSVDAILYTHAHADHIAGVDDARILNRNIGRPINVFGLEKTLTELAERFAYAFKPVTKPGFFRPVLVPQPVTSGQRLTIAGLPMQVFAQDHGYSISLGFRSGGFGYSTDVVRLDEVALGILEHVDTWVVGCVRREGPHDTHGFLAQVYEWVARIKPRRTVLTHMGIDMDWGWLKANLPAGIEPGYDGMVISVES